MLYSIFDVGLVGVGFGRGGGGGVVVVVLLVGSDFGFLVMVVIWGLMVICLLISKDIYNFKIWIFD